ncbi:hypothetical protein F4780DRAFT_25329 [Xylariomycetidae sp. FL0641]|nr:hypothetical protein F4780DRAFT_25329 [Xylariomycetidae sp. FL0641]
MLFAEVRVSLRQGPLPLHFHDVSGQCRPHLAQRGGFVFGLTNGSQCQLRYLTPESASFVKDAITDPVLQLTTPSRTCHPVAALGYLVEIASTAIITVSDQPAFPPSIPSGHEDTEHHRKMGLASLVSYLSPFIDEAIDGHLLPDGLCAVTYPELKVAPELEGCPSNSNTYRVPKFLVPHCNRLWRSSLVVTPYQQNCGLQPWFTFQGLIRRPEVSATSRRGVPAHIEKEWIKPIAQDHMPSDHADALEILTKVFVENGFGRRQLPL